MWVLGTPACSPLDSLLELGRRLATVEVVAVVAVGAEPVAVVVGAEPVAVTVTFG